MASCTATTRRRCSCAWPTSARASTCASSPIGAWTWSESGGYLGVPASNFVGWFLVGIVIYGVFFAVEPDRTEAPAPALDALIVGLIGALGLLALLAVGAHVRHWLPIVLSVAVLAPYFGYWYRTRDRSSS